MLKASDNAAALKDMEKAQADQKKVDYFAKEEQKNQDSLTRIEDALDLLRDGGVGDVVGGADGQLHGLGDGHEPYGKAQESGAVHVPVRHKPQEQQAHQVCHQPHLDQDEAHAGLRWDEAGAGAQGLRVVKD